eukprot:3616860-Rhodomonas_salina.1
MQAVLLGGSAICEHNRQRTFFARSGIVGLIPGNAAQSAGGHRSVSTRDAEQSARRALAVAQPVLAAVVEQCGKGKAKREEMQQAYEVWEKVGSKRRRRARTSSVCPACTCVSVARVRVSSALSCQGCNGGVSDLLLITVRHRATACPGVPTSVSYGSEFTRLERAVQVLTWGRECARLPPRSSVRSFANGLHRSTSNAHLSFQR